MRHVIVTGGSRGLGLALVQGLLTAGYAVSTCSRTLSPALEELGVGCGMDYGSGAAPLFWRAVDVTDPVAVEAFIAAAVAWGGAQKSPISGRGLEGGATLYGLVNNAGLARAGVLATFPDIETATVLATNLAAPIHAARAFLRHLLPLRSGGRIINISSIVGRTGYSGLAVYAASKAGLEGLTRALAREVGPRAITVNAIAPGYLDTEMSAEMSAQHRSQIIRRTPLGRLGTAADVWPLLRFLLSDEAGFITGQTWVVDGGLTG